MILFIQLTSTMYKCTYIFKGLLNIPITSLYSSYHCPLDICSVGCGFENPQQDTWPLLLFHIKAGHMSLQIVEVLLVESSHRSIPGILIWHTVFITSPVPLLVLLVSCASQTARRGPEFVVPVTELPSLILKRCTHLQLVFIKFMCNVQFHLFHVQWQWILRWY